MARDGTPLGFTASFGVLAAVMCLLVPSAVTGPQVDARLGVLAVGMTAVAATVGAVVPALTAAGIGFVLFDGFVEDRYGELVWHGGGDLVRLGVVVAAALAGLTARTLREYVRRRRARRAVSHVDAELTLPRPRAERNRAPAGAREVH
jgi:hypothetical protein